MDLRGRSLLKELTWPARSSSTWVDLGRRLREEKRLRSWLAQAAQAALPSRGARSAA